MIKNATVYKYCEKPNSKFRAATIPKTCYNMSGAQSYHATPLDKESLERATVCPIKKANGGITSRNMTKTSQANLKILNLTESICVKYCTYCRLVKKTSH